MQNPIVNTFFHLSEIKKSYKEIWNLAKCRSFYPLINAIFGKEDTLMSSISALLARVSNGKINEPEEVVIFLNDIDEIQEKTDEIFYRTAWPCTEQARRASQFGKTSALFIAKHYSTISFYYYSKGHHLDAAQNYLDQAIQEMRPYLDYPSEDQEKGYQYCFELSTAYLQWLQILFKQSDKSQCASEEALQRIFDGLNVIEKALSIKQSPEACLRKWHFLQLLDDSGNHPSEDPLIWSKKYLENHPAPSSDEYIKHAQLHGGELAKKRRFDEAQQLFESLRSLREDPITYLCLGKVSDHKNRCIEALKYFQKASELDPNDIEIKLWLISAQVNNFIKSLREEPMTPTEDEIRKWVEISHQFCATFSENVDSFVGKTSMFVSLKELAEHLYMTKLPLIANVLAHLGQYQFAIELHERILQNIDQYLEANIFERSEVVNLYVAIGGLYALQGKNDRGEASLLKAIELDKNLLFSYSNLVGIYVAQEDRKKLMDLWNQLEPLLNACIDEDQKKCFSSTLFNFGSAFAGLAKGLEDPACKQSEEFYRISLKCDSENWDARYSLARILAITENVERWKEAKDLLDGLKKFEESLPFGLSPLKGFSFYFCYSGILALCDEIPTAKRMAIESCKFHHQVDEIKILQSYLDHDKEMDLATFHREIRESIRKLQFNSPIGKWVNPIPLTISEGSFIGYHGTIDTFLDEFKDGAHPHRAEKRQFSGKGFYTTESKEAASYFAVKKSKDEGKGTPILLKITSNSQSDLIGQRVDPKKKLRKETFTHYHFIRSSIDGLEAFSQHYFPENILDKLEIDPVCENVSWSEKEYQDFIKQFKWGC